MNNSDLLIKSINCDDSWDIKFYPSYFIGRSSLVSMDDSGPVYKVWVQKP